VSDETMGALAPIVVYWIYAGAYQMLPPLDRYRMHSRKEEELRNLVSLPTVIKGVLLQQLVQATVALSLFSMTSKVGLTGKSLQPSFLVQIFSSINCNVRNGYLAVLCAPLHASEQVSISSCSFTTPQAGSALCYWCFIQSSTGGASA